MKEFTVRVFRDEVAWVAEVLPGGPDVTAQGSDAAVAIQRLAICMWEEAGRSGLIENIPVRPHDNLERSDDH